MWETHRCNSIYSIAKSEVLCHGTPSKLLLRSPFRSRMNSAVGKRGDNRTMPGDAVTDCGHIARMGGQQLSGRARTHLPYMHWKHNLLLSNGFKKMAAIFWQPVFSLLCLYLFSPVPYFPQQISAGCKRIATFRRTFASTHVVRQPPPLLAAVSLRTRSRRTRSSPTPFSPRAPSAFIVYVFQSSTETPGTTLK